VTGTCLFAFIYLHFLCIWLTLLSKVTCIAFQDAHLHSYQFLLSLGIERMTLVLQALDLQESQIWQMLLARVIYKRA